MTLKYIEVFFISKLNVVRKVVIYIKNNIEDGTWQINSKIPSEKMICEITKASRTSVRNAIQQLNIIGLLETKHGSGTYVCSTDIGLLGEFLNEKPLNNKNEIYRMLEWNEARLILEPTVAYYAALKATPEFVNELEKINEKQRDSVGNQKIFVETDMNFHMALSDFIGNSYVSQALKKILMSVESSSIVNFLMGYHGGVYYHAAITDAIRKNDAIRAMKMMQEHAQDRLDGIKKQITELEKNDTGEKYE